MAQSGGFDDDDTRTLQPTSWERQERREGETAQYIVVVEGTECGKNIEFGLTPIRVGRRRDNELLLDDPFVSSHHCTIAFERGRIWVTDLGSTNGTYLGRKKVEGRVVWPIGTLLEVGHQTLRHEYRHRLEVMHSERLSQDRKHAAAYVRTLLPPPLPTGAVTTNWYFCPSQELGGDIFDYFWLDAERFVFYLADVCGHGIGAALHSVSVFNLVRQKFLPYVDFARPAQVLNALNAALPMERYGDIYFSLWYGVYRPKEATLTFASAGHPPGLLFHNGGRRLDLCAADPPVGVVAGVNYRETTMALSPGARLYLFSDGVYEFTTRDGELWSWHAFVPWFEARVREGDAQPAKIFQTLRRITRTSGFEDDFSILMLNFP